MARGKKGDTIVEVGDITGTSGEINIAAGDIYKGYTDQQVSALIAQITSNFQPKPFDGRCPYKGLSYFEERDTKLFFGRERIIQDLVTRLKESRTVFITGPSGSGKSSLVRAGLIPALKQGAIPGSETWFYATMRPGREPIAELARAASRLAKSTNAEDEICARALTDPTIFARWCEIALEDSSNRRVILFLDQFEELFTQISKETERVAFLNLLTHAGTSENGRVTLLFAMRSDFVSNCAIYPQLNALLNQQFIQIGAMQPAELVSAIAQPALHVGLHVDPDLIAQIINDMKGEPGALPLMQFALKDLFDSQATKSGLVALTLDDYIQRGGIHKSLERHADAAFSKLNPPEQELARSIFGGLIEIGRGTQDTRRTALLDELVPESANADQVGAVIQKLADARLIITDEQADKDTVTLVHEKLIDAWPWLKRLVNENRDVIALKNEIAQDAREWETHKHDASYLYRGARLANTREQLETKKLVLGGMASEFVQASIDAFDQEIEAANQEERRKKRRQNRVIVGSIGFTAITLGLLIFALIQLNISRALQLGAQAQAYFAEQNYNAAALYAYQSNQIHPNEVANQLLGNLPYINFTLGKGLLGHTFYVTIVAWSPDGRLASGSYDNTIILWDLATGQPAQTLKGHTGPVLSVAWSADGRLASGSDDKNIILWDLTTGQPAQTLKGHTGFVTSVAWSPDGRLASGSYDNTIILWDLAAGQPAQTLKDHTGFVRSVAWSPDGRLASGSEDGTIIIWDLATGQPAQTLKDHTGFVRSVAWSPDGRLASGSYDRTIILWDLATGQPAQILKGHTDFVLSVAWSADGRLASGSEDGTIIFWDLTTGQPTQTLKGHTSYVNSVAWSPDGRLASGSYDRTIILWDLAAGQPAHTLKGHTSDVSSVAWSADGRLASGSRDNTIILWDLATGQPAQTLKGHTAFVTSVAWSPDGRLASGSLDNTIILWDLTTGQPAQIMEAHKYVVNSVAWSADGRLASGSDDRNIIIWDLAAGHPPQNLPPRHTSYVNSVAWSPDGRLASGSDDRNIILWDLATGRPALTLKGHTDAIYSVAWSSDGRLASGSRDGTIIFWDLATGQPAQTLKGHTSYVNSVAWSSDGRLASGSRDGTIILWDLAAGQPAQTLKGHTSYVNSVAWSVDGRLASGSTDRTIRVARSNIIRSKSCAWIYRNMTADEWISNMGIYYVYKPACPNLSVPVIDPIDAITNGYWQYAFITWKGRLLILSGALLLLATLGLILYALYKFIFLMLKKTSKRFRKELDTR